MSFVALLYDFEITLAFLSLGCIHFIKDSNLFSSYSTFLPTTDCNRENGFSQDGPENSKQDDSSTDAKGDYKRKQDDVERDVHFPNKSHKNVHGHEGPSRRSNQKFQKQPKHEKLDWGVLRPPKHQNKKH